MLDEILLCSVALTTRLYEPSDWGYGKFEYQREGAIRGLGILPHEVRSCIAMIEPSLPLVRLMSTTGTQWLCSPVVGEDRRRMSLVYATLAVVLQRYGSYGVPVFKMP